MLVIEKIIVIIIVCIMLYFPVLNDMVDEMAERLKKEHGIEEFSNVASPNQVLRIYNNKFMQCFFIDIKYLYNNVMGFHRIHWKIMLAVGI